MVRLRLGSPAGKRLLGIAMVALALAPGTWVRTRVVPNHSQAIHCQPLASALPVTGPFGIRRTGLWRVTSPNSEFGGYSALLLLHKDVLRAFSDHGSRLTFAIPGTSESTIHSLINMWNRGRLSQTDPDLESATRAPATGDYWLGFEHTNAIIHYNLASTFLGERQPPQMRNWPPNLGPEAMVRLADGRFIVLPETLHTGLLFPGDPTRDVTARTFSFDPPDGYHVSDMAQLPDGRVLVLLRKLAWHYPPFSAALAIGDPAQIDREGRLDLTLLVDLDRILPPENYEGLAIGANPDGTVTLWLISDDNYAAMQRTLLARLVWAPRRVP